jgi:hypothetical protein
MTEQINAFQIAQKQFDSVAEMMNLEIKDTIEQEFSIPTP